MGLFGKKSSGGNSKADSSYGDYKGFDQLFAILIAHIDGTIISFNDLFSIQFGYKSSEFEGNPVGVVQLGLMSKEAYSAIYTSIQLSEAYQTEVQIKSKTGNLNSYKMKAAPLPDNKFLLVFEPVRKEKTIVDDAAESNRLFMEMINHMPDIICFKDGAGKWLLANDADLELFQLKGVSYIGKTDADLAPFTHEIYKNSFLTCMDTDEKCWIEREISRGDEIITTPGGNQMSYDVLKIPVFNVDGTRKNLIVVGRDVTERRNTEKELIASKLKAEEADRLKSAFLATMSHELRTPLNAIIGFANLIFEEENINEIREFSRIINNNSNVLLNLIEDIFDISLIEAQQMQVERHKFDIVKTIYEVFEIFPHEIHILDKLDIDLKILINEPGMLVCGDEYRVKQILINLIRNALKFTMKGYVHIKLRETDDFVEIDIEDSGIGIASEKLDFIFQMFQQVEEGSKRKYGGAGLGLSISKQLAVMMDGDITVKSELDKGSVFSLRLPKTSQQK